MQEFKAYLLSIRIAGPKAVAFYIHWVTQFYRFTGKRPEVAATQQEVEVYLHP